MKNKDRVLFTKIVNKLGKLFNLPLDGRSIIVGKHQLGIYENIMDLYKRTIFDSKGEAYCLRFEFNPKLVVINEIRVLAFLIIQILTKRIKVINKDKV